MLTILGNRRRLCDGSTRREFLRAGATIGALGLPGLALPGMSGKVSALTVNGKLPARAKSCILLYLYGAPSQVETFDMKPAAPVEVRGEFKPIPSSVPGSPVCELLPNTARVMDRVSLIRSVTHAYPIHGVAFATTGIPNIEVAMELSPRDGRHHPFMGSVVDHLLGPRPGSTLPANIGLPWRFSSRREGEVPRAGPYASFLGGQHDPVWCSMVGDANVRCKKTLNQQVWEGGEPYRGVDDQAHFALDVGAPVQGGLILDRLNGRQSLLQQYERQLRAQSSLPSTGIDAMAWDLVRSPELRNALDVRKEPERLRQSYGMTVFGQGALAARRLVEAGSRFVSVFWDEFGLAGSGWDTHWNHFPRMKEELLPGLDKAYAGLILDLEQRGMLDETLVLLLSEHGRTPRLQNVDGGGRDHWSRCYSVVLAGGGTARGAVLGKSDKIGGDVMERPVSPKDVLATAYHLLGIDPEAMLIDRTNRPIPVAGGASVIREILT